MKLKELNIDLVGKPVPSKWDGQAGRYVEKLLEDAGIHISRTGIDTHIHGIGVEVKTRDVDSVSPQTLATMRIEDIIDTPFENSLIWEKFKTQFRVKTKDNVIISADIYNFGDNPGCVQIVKTAYETARAKIDKDNFYPGVVKNFYTGNEYAYFEKTGSDGTLAFRFAKGKLEQLENMAQYKSQYNNLFEEA